MIDGKTLTILGVRGMGKSILALTLFDMSTRPSVYISPMEPAYNLQRLKSYDRAGVGYYNRFRDYAEDPRRYEKIYFKFYDRWDYIKLFYILKDQSGINIFLDEAALWLNQWKVEPSIGEILTLGRARSINFIVIAQRPAMLNPTTVGLSDTIISFYLYNINDIKYIEGTCGPDFARRIKEAPQFKFYIYGDLSIFENL